MTDDIVWLHLVLPAKVRQESLIIKRFPRLLVDIGLGVKIRSMKV